MRIENLEIKKSHIEIVALDRIGFGNSCDTCEHEGDFARLKIITGTVCFHAFVGTFCAEKYLKMLAE